MRNVLLVVCAVGISAACKNDSANAQLNKQASAQGTTSSQPLGPDRPTGSPPKTDQPGSSAAARGSETKATTASAQVDGRANAGGGSAAGASAGSPSSAIAMVARDPALLVQTLHKDNQAEIEAGKLAQKKSRSKEVKQLGADLVRDHQAADKQLSTYAKKHNLELGPSGKTPAMREQTTGTTTQTNTPSSSPPGLVDPMALVQQLRSAPPEQFDQLFAQGQAMAHRQSVDLVTAAQASTQDEELKTLLGQLLPKLQEHLHMAQSAESGGAPGADHASGQPQGRRGSTR
jgi:putative membrane protein